MLLEEDPQAPASVRACSPDSSHSGVGPLRARAREGLNPHVLRGVITLFRPRTYQAALFENPDIRRWHANVAQGSFASGACRARGLAMTPCLCASPDLSRPVPRPTSSGGSPRSSRRGARWRRWCSRCPSPPGRGGRPPGRGGRARPGAPPPPPARPPPSTSPLLREVPGPGGQPKVQEVLAGEEARTLHTHVDHQNVGADETCEDACGSPPAQEAVDHGVGHARRVGGDPFLGNPVVRREDHDPLAGHLRPWVPAYPRESDPVFLQPSQAPLRLREVVPPLLRQSAATPVDGR